MDSNTQHLIDLRVAQEELLLHHQELVRCTDELKIANELIEQDATQHVERKAALNSDLEHMMFTISHKVRKSVANIIGISKLLCDDQRVDIVELREMLQIIIHSAESLNMSTEELSQFIHAHKNSA